MAALACSGAPRREKDPGGKAALWIYFVMDFYNCLNRLCEQIGCSFDTAFLIALWGFALLFHASIQFIRWLFSRRKKNRP
ncbi:hypothetical protein [uncultured Oscillibacter sp.]|uniref:hypothetical protein n=1 Tax=uncultured Oscillibacter sp. TaxID=876091 RepID=UPI002634D502|nr:hypothetical protein [uncultured Oscillibacter sp.]